MRQAATFCLAHPTLKKLRAFARRSGIPQSALVESILSQGLRHLEKNWRSTDDVLKRALAVNGKNPKGKCA
jgi:hypothetical protein